MTRWPPVAARFRHAARVPRMMWANSKGGLSRCKEPHAASHLGSTAAIVTIKPAGVSAVLKESLCICCSYRRDRRAQRLNQSFTRAGFGLPQEGLDLRESPFDGVEVGRVGGQEEQHSPAPRSVPQPYLLCER
jgi:hypothetical protein